MKKVLVDVNRKIVLKFRKCNNVYYEQVLYMYFEFDVIIVRIFVMVE